VSAPFLVDDLAELDARLLSRADRVVSMRDVFDGDTDPRTIGLRHDVDDNPRALDTALRMAEWEAARGYSSSYYLLHDSHYWDNGMPVVAPLLEELGHEVGLHVNAIAEALRQDRDPHDILRDALVELRATGVTVTGCVGHGDGLCRQAGFVNDEVFVESPRPDWGAPERTVSHAGVDVEIRPVSRAVYGLDYDAIWLPRGAYLSDSGGRWQNGYSNEAFDQTAVGFPFDGQLHLLQHPDHWGRAFVPAAVEA
jgi:hypothetical protein